MAIEPRHNSQHGEGGVAVRYRIHQLQQLFGDKLTDPDTRLTMELALRAHLLLTPPTPG